MNKGDLVDRLRELGAIDRTLLIVPHSLLTQAADEIARLREALEHIARLGVDMRADFSRSAQQSEIARAALQHKEPQG